jgi:hypothetical protein
MQCTPHAVHTTCSAHHMQCAPHAVHTTCHAPPTASHALLLPLLRPCSSAPRLGLRGTDTSLVCPPWYSHPLPLLSCMKLPPLLRSSRTCRQTGRQHTQLCRQCKAADWIEGAIGRDGRWLCGRCKQVVVRAMQAGGCAGDASRCISEGMCFAMQGTCAAIQQGWQAGKPTGRAWAANAAQRARAQPQHRWQHQAQPGHSPSQLSPAQRSGCLQRSQQCGSLRGPQQLMQQQPPAASAPARQRASAAPVECCHHQRHRARPGQLEMSALCWPPPVQQRRWLRGAAPVLRRALEVLWQR